MATPVTQNWASLQDLTDMGPPVEALYSKSVREKLRALRAGSGLLASYARGRYKLPLSVQVEELDLTGITQSQVTLQGTPEEAFSLAIRFDAGTAGAGAIPIEWTYSWIDGATPTYDNTGTLPASGIYQVSSGFSILLQGPIPQDATIKILAGVDWSLRVHVVNIAAYNLIYNRGVNPDSTPGKELSKRYDDAMKWARDLQDEKSKIEEGSDSTPTKKETGPRGTGQQQSWDWLC